jgi:DNA-binding transcriptional LysR family regulator
MPGGYGAGVELRHLRYAVAVADALSFTRAADRLRVAQPALSRQIRQLEDEIGVRLFERNRRAVSLTDAGAKFVSEARAVLERSEAAVRAARESGAGKAVSLDVGYVWGLFHSIVPAAIARFRAARPDVAVNLFDQTATRQAAALAEGRLDAGLIGFAHEADAVGLAKRRIGSCRFVAALPAGHRAARRRLVSLASLAGDSFFVISEDHYPGASRFALAACERAGFRPRVLQAAERGHTILGLVAGNCGVALLPEPLRGLPHDGVVFRPLAEPLEADLFVAWLADRRSPERDAFLDAVTV